MVAEITDALAGASPDPGVRVVVLRSTGKSFCAGADLQWMQRMATYSEAENLADARALEAMFRAFTDCVKPIVARVQGAAFGGGAGLVAASDVVVASEDAKLRFPEVTLGLLPAVIAPYVMRRPARARARALFLTGETIDARRAAELGLVDRLVPAAQLDTAVDEAVKGLLLGSPQAQASAKRLVSDLDGCTLGESADVTTRAIAAARESDDGREGTSAFLAKRKARWINDNACP
jgi:methylglutaconyl-CoA hydratase